MFFFWIKHYFILSILLNTKKTGKLTILKIINPLKSNKKFKLILNKNKVKSISKNKQKITKNEIKKEILTLDRFFKYFFKWEIRKGEKIKTSKWGPISFRIKISKIIPIIK